MNIKTIPIDRINAAAYNPRVDLQPGDPEYEKLLRSIEEFGYVEPIVWNERTGNMVGGHQRYKIMVHELGHSELEVSVVNLDDQQERLLNLALNKVSGRWDDEALARLLEELQEAGANLELSGFEDGEISRLLADFAEPPEDQIGDFTNKELDTSEFDESKFDCKCPRCGFVFDQTGIS
ncbi:ParB-like nuclease domain protein [compost metagenome]